MPDSLAARLRTIHVDHLIRSAEAIRDWPNRAERIEQAIRHIRQAMFLCAVGKITQVEESRVFSLLSFAMPEPDAPFESDGMSK